MKKLIALVALLVSLSANAGNPMVIAEGKNISQVKMALAKYYSTLPGKTLVVEGDNLILTETGLFSSTIAVTSLISDGKDTMVTLAMFSKMDDITANVLSPGMSTSKNAIAISDADQKQLEGVINSVVNKK